MSITVKFCSVQSHQNQPSRKCHSEHIKHYHTLYGNLSCLMSSMATFCLNILPINHLQNISSYELSMAINHRQLRICKLKGTILQLQLSMNVYTLYEGYLLFTINWEVIWDYQMANLSQTLTTTNWKLYNCTTKMLFNQKHVHLIAYKLLSKLCSMFTVMTLIISFMTWILLISCINLLHFSRCLLCTERLIYYIFIMHMPAC